MWQYRTNLNQKTELENAQGATNEDDGSTDNP